jgi:hypothetical protein
MLERGATKIRKVNPTCLQTKATIRHDLGYRIIADGKPLKRFWTWNGPSGASAAIVVGY